MRDHPARDRAESEAIVTFARRAIVSVSNAPPATSTSSNAETPTRDDRFATAIAAVAAEGITCAA